MASRPKGASERAPRHRPPAHSANAAWTAASSASTDSGRRNADGLATEGSERASASTDGGPRTADGLATEGSERAPAQTADGLATEGSERARRAPGEVTKP
ncbi:MAG: hypothetical protein CMN29_33130 [Sandaracinus sp.]|nr:hypothetical protein [Sandaracinus sp.]